ncbi:MAG: spermidine/putrescine ABC transporter substrate-binding protein [Bryobacteraceae bacterium]|nr:spermidine/putrescine ABC transporter substrate-binding protein [Bryobacteraceae bacterium]
MKRRTFFLGIAGAAGCTPRGPRLNVFNWSNYIASDTIARFEAETGARVRYAVYESNEEMLARVISGNSGWDVVFPTNYFIEPMRAMGLLARLNLDLLPNRLDLFDEFQAPEWDPRLEWSMPYMWGCSGILYHERVAPAPRRWADMWDDRFRGRLTMLDDPAEVLGAALLKLGLSLNETSEAGLRRAQAEAIRQKPLVRAYLNAEVRDQMVAGDILACQLWATTAQQAMDEAPELRFAFPEEGFPLYADCAVVLKESDRAELAHRFIDYLMRPEVGAAIVRESRTATCNLAALRVLGEVLPPTLHLDQPVLARGQWFAAMPSVAQRLRDRLWTEIKSA